MNMKLKAIMLSSLAVVGLLVCIALLSSAHGDAVKQIELSDRFPAGIPAGMRARYAVEKALRAKLDASAARLQFNADGSVEEPKHSVSYRQREHVLKSVLDKDTVSRAKHLNEGPKIVKVHRKHNLLKAEAAGEDAHLSKVMEQAIAHRMKLHHQHELTVKEKEAHKTSKSIALAKEHALWVKAKAEAKKKREEARASSHALKLAGLKPGQKPSTSQQIAAQRKLKRLLADTAMIKDTVGKVTELAHKWGLNKPLKQVLAEHANKEAMKHVPKAHRPQANSKWSFLWCGSHF